MRINPLAFPTFLIGGALFWIGTRLAQTAHSKTARYFLLVVALVCGTPGLLYVIYYLHLFDNAGWFYNFRAIRFTELLAGGLGLIAGLLHGWNAAETVSQKLFVPTVLLALILIPFLKPVLSPVDLGRLNPECTGDVCLQSTEFTCGPASAATILRALGLIASERQLAEDSFTAQSGTENWYLVRSLRKRGLNAHVTIDESLQAPFPSPSIAGVKLAGGAGHFVAVLSDTPGEVTLVDPLVGRLVMPRAQLFKRYQFTGFFLKVSRESK